MGPFDANWLTAAIILTTPVLFAATGELIAERSGIINIGLEGMILTGAFVGFIVYWKTGSPGAGIVAGLAGGMTLSAVMAFLSIEAYADQIVVGVGLNILAAGVTTFAYEQIFSARPQVLLNPMARESIPLLHRIPGIGDPLFSQPALSYVAYVLVPVVWFLLFKTSWGLAIRAAGEVPATVETAGIGVKKVRWLTTLTAGALAGLGGAMLSVVQLGLFIQGMSSGRGFLALAAVIFGRWRPLGVLGACLVFGGADALQIRLQATGNIPGQVWFVIGTTLALAVGYRLTRARRRDVSFPSAALGLVLAGGAFTLLAIRPHWSLPSQMWLTLPYVLALLVLGGFVGRTHVPTALALPYRRGGKT
jgi:simple sugar transport system permease protein